MEDTQVIELLKLIKPMFVPTQDRLIPLVGVLGAIGGALATIFPSFIMEKISQKNRRTSTALQIYAEIKSSLEIENRRKYGDTIQSIISNFKQNLYSVEISDSRFAIYKANLSNLGLLPPTLQVKIVYFYQTIEAIIQDVKPGGILNTNPTRLESFKEVFQLITEAKSVGKEVLETIEGMYLKNFP